VTTTESPTEPQPAGWRPQPPAPREPTAAQRWVPLGLLLAGILALAVAGGWSLLVVVLAIVVMITLHELGHYLTAKAAGMKVTEFFLGFGPRLWSFRKGETEYGIKAIPAGAYVKIVGMHNLDLDVDPAEEERTYRSKPYWRRMSVAVAGSGMHFLLAFGCIFSLLVFDGTQGGKLFATESQFTAMLDTSADYFIAAVDPGTPAAAAGIKAGDKIVRFDGHAVRTFGDVRKLVVADKGKTVTITVRRGKADVDLTATIGARKDDETKGFLGVAPDLPVKKVGVLAAVPRTFVEFGRLGEETVTGLGHIFSPRGVGDLADQVAHPSQDQPTTPVSGGAGGSGSSSPDERPRPLSIIGLSAIGSQVVRQGWVGAITLLALVNMFVGIFNLVPLLPLDGGHVAIATYERLRSRKGKPYRADVAKLLPLTYAVVLLLIFVGVAAMFLDIVNPVTIPN
jgi:membrane-associated protease RseP (regulator of RpoE activity)